MLAGKERGAALLDICGAGEIDEQRQGLVGSSRCLEKSNREIVQLDMEVVEAMRIVGKQIGNRDGLHIFAMRFERVEGRGEVGRVHGLSGLAEERFDGLYHTSGCTRSGRTPRPMARAGSRLSQGMAVKARMDQGGLSLASRLDRTFEMTRL